MRVSLFLQPSLIPSDRLRSKKRPRAKTEEAGGTTIPQTGRLGGGRIAFLIRRDNAGEVMQLTDSTLRCSQHNPKTHMDLSFSLSFNFPAQLYSYNKPLSKRGVTVLLLVCHFHVKVSIKLLLGDRLNILSYC